MCCQFPRNTNGLLPGVLLIFVLCVSLKAQMPAGQALLSDNFSQDKTLNATLWITGTPLLKSLGQKSSAVWVAPQVAFSSAGMAMSGVSGIYQFTGIQSVQSFTPPFITQVTVMGTVADGNPFVFYLVTGDLSQSVSLLGNLNPRDGSYYGINLNTTDTFIPSAKLYPSPAVNVWYTISIAVDATGKANVTLAGANGIALASQNGINLGTKPFYLALAQLEGLPYAASTGPNTAIWQQIQVSTPAMAVPTVNAGGALNAASYAGAPLAPGSIVAVYGNFLLGAPSQSFALPLPTSLSGLSLQFGNVTAPLFYASGGQVNLQVPWGLAGQATSPLSATLNGQTGAAETVQLAAYSPGIFTMNAQGTGQGAILDASYRLVDDFNPAVPGSAVLQIFCTGLGPVTNQPPSGSPAPTGPSLSETTKTPTVTVGTVPANVLFSGLAPGYVGLYQVNALVPAMAPAGNAVPVVISIGGVNSNAVMIAVQGPTGTGTLDIQVTGLPAGTPGNVSVASPNGYATGIIANTSLQVRLRNLQHHAWPCPGRKWIILCGDPVHQCCARCNDNCTGGVQHDHPEDHKDPGPAGSTGPNPLHGRQHTYAARYQFDGPVPQAGRRFGYRHHACHPRRPTTENNLRRPTWVTSCSGDDAGDARRCLSATRLQVQRATVSPSSSGAGAPFRCDLL